MSWGTDEVSLADERHFEILNGLWTGKRAPFATAGVIRNTNFTESGRIDYSDVAWLQVEQKQLAKRQLLPGDIIVERSGGGPKQPVGRVVYFDRRDALFSFSNFTSAIRVRDTKAFDPKFVFYGLLELYQSGRTEDIQRRTTGIRNLDFPAYKERAKFPCIPLAEQSHIVEVLGILQRAVEQQEELLALAAELKRGLLSHLFTHGLRREPQKPTDIGLLPESWAATTLGELASEPHGFLQTGPFGSQLHKHEYTLVGTGVVNPTHLWGNRINHEDVPRVSPQTAGRLDRHVLEAGDILFARRGEIGRHGMVTKDEEGWLCGTGCFLARVREEYIDNRFLSYQFSTSGATAWLNSHAAGAIMPNLSNKVLRSLPVFYPPREVQIQIADCLDAAEQKIVVHQQKVSTFTSLFRTTLHQLMTAQMRVHEVEPLSRKAS